MSGIVDVCKNALVSSWETTKCFTSACACKVKDVSVVVFRSLSAAAARHPFAFGCAVGAVGTCVIYVAARVLHRRYFLNRPPAGGPGEQPVGDPVVPGDSRPEDEEVVPQ